MEHQQPYDPNQQMQNYDPNTPYPQYQHPVPQYQQPPAQYAPQQYQQFPQAQHYPQQQFQPQMQQQPQQVFNTRGYATLQADYSLTGIMCIDVAWLESLILRYRQGDPSLMDVNMQGQLTGKLKLSLSAKYSMSQSGKSTHKVSLFNRADLPPR